MSVLSKPYFHDEEAAYAKLEAIIWPEGPVCPHCGCMGRIYKMTANAEKRIRIGLHKCGDCRKQFTVKVGTVFESSHVKLHLWFQAAYLMASSKKGISAHQLHRTLGVTYKTAWFMAHRLREAMATVGIEPMGGEGKWVEADETFVGGKEKNKHVGKRKRGNIGGTGKEIVFSLVERGGKVHSRHVPSVTAKTLRPILVAQLDAKTYLMTDDAGQYRNMPKDFPAHQTVNHSIDEYVRGEAHTNTVEGYFSILKRGIVGTYHHVSQQHLKRYLAEFDFRYNERMALGVNDDDRANRALSGIVGKRLKYHPAY
mgnify:CR=1 FL=1